MSNPDQSPALSLEEFTHWLNDRRMLNVSEAFHAIVSRYSEAVAPTEAAAMAATVPAGWRLVPEMPTKEMLAAAGKACEGRMYPASMTHGPRAQNTDRYIAMLDAAPKAPVADEARMLRDLLARIHGDGGQYLDQHGLAKAVQDADELVAKWHAGQPAEPSPAALEMLLDAADEWANYVIEDRAPMTLRKYLENVLAAPKGEIQ